jgi:hypothetical protein
LVGPKWNQIGTATLFFQRSGWLPIEISRATKDSSSMIRGFGFVMLSDLDDSVPRVLA